MHVLWLFICRQNRGIVAGIAFILPGFILMLLASYLYSLAGLENIYFNASFKALQPIVAAMVLVLICQQIDFG